MAEMERQPARCERMALNTPETLCAVRSAFPTLAGSL